jgi:hypothetical protein
MSMKVKLHVQCRSMSGSRRAERPNQAIAVESGWGPGADFSGRWPRPHNTNRSRNWEIREAEVAAIIEDFSVV